VDGFLAVSPALKEGFALNAGMSRGANRFRELEGVAGEKETGASTVPAPGLRYKSIP
jgi:hypothetical protein